jgi:hypothetical protein
MVHVSNMLRRFCSELGSVDPVPRLNFVRGYVVMSLKRANGRIGPGLAEWLTFTFLYLVVNNTESCTI